MESSYGIGVKNRYAVFIGEEEEDPLEILTKSEEKHKSADKASTTRAVRALNDSKLSNTNHQNIIKDKTNKDSLNKSKTSDGLQSLSKNKDMNTKGDPNRTQRPKPDRNPRTRDANQTGDKPNHISDRQNRPPRPSTDQKEMEDVKNQRNRDEHFGQNNDMRERRERSDNRGRNVRNGARRGSGGGRFGDERRGKRDLDRHSGSDKAGVKAVDKREGGGAHNWGKINDFDSTEPFTADTDRQELTDRSADETALGVDDANAENDVNANEDPNKEAVEEPKEMTLEEYKRELEEKRVQPKFNLRKPGEGEDNSQWKKTFVLKKKIEDEEEVEYEEIEVEEDPRKGRHKQILDIEINFRDEGREFPRRGDGRRGGRDRRGGDRDRGDRDRPERSDRGERPERADRQDRAERGERSDRGERPERSDRGERSDRDRPDRGERGERRDRGGERGGGGGRGGRGGDRSFGERPRTRRPRDPKEQTAPKVDDWNDFPSLAAA